MRVFLISFYWPLEIHLNQVIKLLYRSITYLSLIECKEKYMMQPSLAWNSIADLNNLRMKFMLIHTFFFSCFGKKNTYIKKRKRKERMSTSMSWCLSNVNSSQVSQTTCTMKCDGSLDRLQNNGLALMLVDKTIPLSLGRL